MRSRQGEPYSISGELSSPHLTEQYTNPNWMENAQKWERSFPPPRATVHRASLARRPHEAGGLVATQTGGRGTIIACAPEVAKQKRMSGNFTCFKRYQVWVHKWKYKNLSRCVRSNLKKWKWKGENWNSGRKTGNNIKDKIFRRKQQTKT